MERIWEWNRRFDRMPGDRRTLTFILTTALILFLPLPVQIALIGTEYEQSSKMFTMIPALILGVVALVRLHWVAVVSRRN